ncbi:MAG: GreA/GreB family elongation factor [Rhodopirellula sp. JB044]|uniref:GreA/GreB family elongation factor n=1 Tax=Rhodopirellula sp. JB044 TaxID=3342844 RepID=UPI00370B5E2C
MYLNELDYERLTRLLDTNFAQALGDRREHLFRLQERMMLADVLPPERMPRDIITMNTTLKLVDVERNEVEVYTLVYPEEACIVEGKLSILSPLGASLLGRRIGDMIRLRVAARDCVKRVENISFQPERCGAFHM